MNHPKIGLALGAGSARGLAHIGVLDVLEQHKIAIHCVAGTSIGAIIGGLYAADVDRQLLARMATALNWDDLVRLTLSSAGFVSSERIYQMLRVLTKDADIEQLRVPAAFVAADLYTGEQVVFRRGNAATAIRASMSIPGVFVPVELEGRLLVDGALKNRVPDDIPPQLGADFVIGVDVGFPEPRGRLKTVPDIIMRTVDILERDIAESRGQRAHFTIKMDMPDVMSTQLNRAAEIIERGRQRTAEVMPELLDVLGRHRQS